MCRKPAGRVAVRRETLHLAHERHTHVGDWRQLTDPYQHALTSHCNFLQYAALDNNITSTSCIGPHVRSSTGLRHRPPLEYLPQPTRAVASHEPRDLTAWEGNHTQPVCGRLPI